MPIHHLTLLSAALILIVTILSGLYPFIRKIYAPKSSQFPIAESLAVGVFLGAGLIHMLSDSAKGFIAQGYHYPYAYVLAGAIFLFLLLLEHIGREIYEHDSERSVSYVILATLMLSIHSFLAGAALGISTDWSVFIMILLAILAHKWAVSLALAVQINKTSLKLSVALLLFAVFAMMTPLGLLFGHMISYELLNKPILKPLFSAFAAGTFLYLGTLHGLKNAVMVDKCCDLRRYLYVILGFVTMAVVAIWI